jgi:hypothetical protein
LDNGAVGIITNYTLAVSSDGANYADVSTGTWADDSSVKSASFSPVTARYLRITVTGGAYGYASAAEFWPSDVPTGG